MKNFILIYLFILTSCDVNKFNLGLYKQSDPLQIIAVEPSSFFLDEKSTSFEIKFNRPFMQALNFFIDGEPVKAIVKKKSNSIKVTGKNLKPESFHTIYWDDKPIHSFYVQNKAKLISHNIYDQEENFMGKNRKYIRLEFDEEVKITSKDTFKFMSMSPQEAMPKIKEINLSIDKKHVELKLKDEEFFLLNGEYALIFDDNLKIEPIKFVVKETKEPLLKVAPLNVAVSHNSAKISLASNRDFVSEIYYGLDDKEMNCLDSKCPKIFYAKKAIDEFLMDLKPNTKYKMIVRSEDMYGEKIIYGATFKTNEGPQLIMSEINTEEDFIKVFNASNKPIPLDSADISIGNKRCHLSSKQPIILEPKYSALIVGSDFLGKKDIFIHYLNTKTICGGFSGKKPKTIILWKNNTEFFDSSVK